MKRDQVRSRSEPCLCYMTTRRSKALSHSGSRCLSPLTPRRLASQISPRVQPATERLRHRESRRWSCHSIPSIPSDRGYLTQDLILITFLIYEINLIQDFLKSHAIPFWLFSRRFASTYLNAIAFMIIYQTSIS